MVLPGVSDRILAEADRGNSWWNKLGCGLAEVGPAYDCEVGIAAELLNIKGGVIEEVAGAAARGHWLCLPGAALDDLAWFADEPLPQRMNALCDLPRCGDTL